MHRQGSMSAPSTPVTVAPIAHVAGLSNGLLVLFLVLSASIRKRSRTPERESKRAPNKRRRREGTVDDLLDLEDRIFLRMMRMPKDLFSQLARFLLESPLFEHPSHRSLAAQ
jgi:hypothetical protein